MKGIWKWVIPAIVVVSLGMSACKKDKAETDTDITVAEDQNQGDMIFDAVLTQTDAAAESKGLNKGGYPIITIDTISTPRTMRIDYGTSNYLCTDGNYRRGAILVSWTGRYRATGSVITIGFDQFYHNDNHVEGSKVITNNGRNSDNNLYYTIVVNATITTPDGLSHTWNSNRTRTWTRGELTMGPLDDEYEITGSTSGVNRKGIAYTATITKKLTIWLRCEWRIVSGTIDVSPAGKATRTIDFGEGACDRLVTVTINGKSKTFERRK